MHTAAQVIKIRVVWIVAKQLIKIRQGPLDVTLAEVQRRTGNAKSNRFRTQGQDLVQILKGKLEGAFLHIQHPAQAECIAVVWRACKGAVELGKGNSEVALVPIDA